MLKRKKPESSGRTRKDSVGKTAPVFSYYSSRLHETENINRSTPQKVAPRVRSRTGQGRWVRYAPAIFSLVVVGVAFLYSTTLNTNSRLELDGHGTSISGLTRSLQEYEYAISVLMDTSLLNQSKLTINTDKLAEDIEGQFPELHDVTVTVPLIGRKLLIQANVSKPIVILSGAGGSFGLNTRGIPIVKASDLPSSVRDALPVVIDSADNEIRLGKQVLTSEFTMFIYNLARQADADGINVESYTLPTDSNEVHIKPKGEGYHIKFYAESDVRTQVGTYLALKKHVEAEGKSVAEYIDVRVEERAYYR